MEHFKSILRANRYKNTTIDAYVTTLVDSGVNLHDKRAVHRVVSSRIFDDSHGQKFRAFLCYDRFLRNMTLPGGLSPKRGPRRTMAEFCMSQKTKDGVSRAWWLLNQHPRKRYSVGTAVTYMSSLLKTDKHKDGDRARAAFEGYDPAVVTITDPHVLAYRNNLAV